MYISFTRITYTGIQNVRLVLKVSTVIRFGHALPLSMPRMDSKLPLVTGAHMSRTQSASSEQAHKLAMLAPKIMGAFHSLNRHHPSGAAITMRQYQTLILLSVHTHLTVSELCEKLTLAASTCTELVNRLLQLGFVEKHSEEVDRRQVGIHLTDLGREVMEQRQRDVVAMFEGLLAQFTAEEAAELVGSFEKIQTLLQAHFQPPPEVMITEAE